MKYLIPITALLSITTAAPWDILARRALTPHDLEGRNYCPKNLQQGQYEYPHYITHISKSYPDKSWGPQYNGKCTPHDIATVFSFDIPASRAGANCVAEFLFPKQEQLQTSSYTYSGPGTFYFKGYKPGSCADGKTTWNHQPEPDGDGYNTVHMEPGYAYTIDMGPCSAAAGTCIAGMMWSPDTHFEYFQDYNPCPIGLYFTYSYESHP